MARLLYAQAKYEALELGDSILPYWQVLSRYSQPWRSLLKHGRLVGTCCFVNEHAVLNSHLNRPRVSGVLTGLKGLGPYAQDLTSQETVPGDVCDLTSLLSQQQYIEEATISQIIL